MNSSALYRLITWLSPSFPVGAYSYSHGLEYAIFERIVQDREGLVDWVGTILDRGNGFVDGVIFSAAWRATNNGDYLGLREVADLAYAFRGTQEFALESRAQGEAFAMIVRTVWNVPVLSNLMEEGNESVAYPVAVGAACAAVEIPLELGLEAFLHAFAVNLVSAGVRLIPLGQRDGQRAIVALEQFVHGATEKAQGTHVGEIGSATPMVDWASIKHETQHTRLFRT